MTTHCSFGQLRDLLLELGFTMKVLPDANIFFELKPARARIFLPHFGEAEPVDPANMVIVARNLDERGILPREQFELLLRERKLAV